MGTLVGKPRGVEKVSQNYLEGTTNGDLTDDDSDRAPSYRTRADKVEPSTSRDHHDLLMPSMQYHERP
jgi:hypothetical protein